VTDDDIWAELMWAGLNKDGADLLQSDGRIHASEMIRTIPSPGYSPASAAMSSVGCIRRQHDKTPIPATAIRFSPAESSACSMSGAQNRHGVRQPRSLGNADGTDHADPVLKGTGLGIAGSLLRGPAPRTTSDLKLAQAKASLHDWNTTLRHPSRLQPQLVPNSGS
jgi:hypothetical protein